MVIRSRHRMAYLSCLVAADGAVFELEGASQCGAPAGQRKRPA